MNPITRRVTEVVDHLLLEHGELDPFECLLGLGLLHRADYEAWRSARRMYLQSALLVPLQEAVASLEQAQAYARAQGLTAGTGRPAARGAASGDVGIGSSPRLAELCGCVLRRSDERPQTDLFHDSLQTVVLNKLWPALAEHRAEAARAALRRLDEVAPGLPAIEDYRRLLRACAPSPAPPPERLHELDTEIAPLAVRRLGPRARGYLSPLWTELAMALAGTAFSAAAPKLHASYAYAQARRWPEAARSVEAEPDWLRHATLVARLAEARARQGRQHAARRLWARLCWDHPKAAAGILAQAPGDPVLARLWGEFLGAEMAFAVRDFPAWLLLADPRQGDFVPADSAPDDTRGRAYAALHRVIASGGDMDARKALHALRPDLLKLYLAGKSFVARGLGGGAMQSAAARSSRP